MDVIIITFLRWLPVATVLWTREKRIRLVFKICNRNVNER
jgi:hypothetical protein